MFAAAGNFWFDCWTFGKLQVIPGINFAGSESGCCPTLNRTMRKSGYFFSAYLKPLTPQPDSEPDVDYSLNRMMDIFEIASS